MEREEDDFEGFLLLVEESLKEVWDNEKDEQWSKELLEASKNLRK